jgi:hypothetical protein
MPKNTPSSYPSFVQYPQEYFSGTQAAIYFRDIFIDEVTFISYTLQQSKTPIYGYGSQLFDAVVPGIVIVEGVLNINFRDSGYLWLAMSRYKSLESLVDLVVKKYDPRTTKKDRDAAVSEIENLIGLGFVSKDDESLLAEGLNSSSGIGGSPIPHVQLAGQTFDQGYSVAIQKIVTGKATAGERNIFLQYLAGLAGSKKSSEIF